MIRTRLITLSILCLFAPGCGSDATNGIAPADTGPSSDAGDIAEAPKSLLGGPCVDDGDCVAGICLRSEYGPPWCTRECNSPGEACPAGEDAGEGETLCLDYSDLPQPDTAGLVFKGDVNTFCVRRCKSLDECHAVNLDWEVCDKPRYLGDPLDAGLGDSAVCLAPSFHGKDPVDPQTCAFDKIVMSDQASDANLCRNYCKYLDRCKEIPSGRNLECCAWGCFVQMWPEGRYGDRYDPWHDETLCFWQNHLAYPDVAQNNSCNMPPKECGNLPVDPTPHASR